MCEPRCAQHCYDGSEYDRIRHLETQNGKLHAEVNDAKREIAALKSELNKGAEIEKFPWWAHYQPHRAYLMGKIQRQQAAIRNIQKVGWQPSCIIREVPYPDDAHLWLEEPIPWSERRERKAPDMSLLD